MKISARIKSVIEILGEVFTHPEKPADAVLSYYMRNHKFIGSKDRRFISDALYLTLRHWFLIEHFYKKHKLSLDNRLKNMVAISLLLAGYDMEQITTEIFVNDSNGHTAGELDLKDIKKLQNLYDELRDIKDDLFNYYRNNIDSIEPKWLFKKFTESYDGNKDKAAEILFSMYSAPTVDIRINPLKVSIDNRETIIKELRNIFSQNQDNKNNNKNNDKNIEITSTPISPVGIRIKERVAINNTELFKSGKIEIQDEGSQLLSLIVDAKPGQRVLDMCAGAGGKTLMIAAMMQNKGQIVATDVSKKRLDNMKERLKRANVHNVQTKVIAEKNDKWLQRKEFDIVLCDVPCLGTGTLRRNPDIKLKIDGASLADIKIKQMEILELAGKLVKKGGKIIYSTCSLLSEENEEQIKMFLENHNDQFKIIPIAKDKFSYVEDSNITKEGFLHLNPKDSGTDGFFAAIIERN